MGAHRTWKWAPFCFSHLPPCASLPVPSPPTSPASIILSSQTWKLLPELTLWWYLLAFVLIFISAPWILIFEAGSNTFPEWRDLLEAGGGSQHQIISIIIIQRGGILLQPRGERKKKKRWVRQIHGALEAQSTLLYFHRKWRCGFCSCYRSTRGKMGRFQCCLALERCGGEIRLWKQGDHPDLRHSFGI